MKKSIIIIIILLFILIFSGCGSIVPESEENTSLFTQMKDEEFDEYIKMHAGFTEVAQNDRFVLSVDPLSTEFSLMQKENGKTWYSNPQDRFSDSLASEYTQSLLSSQIMVEYFDKTNKRFVFNSFDNSVEMGNYSFSKLDEGDGVSILYELQESEKIYIVPLIIEKSRFENFVSLLNEEEKTYILNRYNFITLEGVSEEHRKVLLTNYPSIESHELYVLVGNMPGFVMERLENYFSIAGYSKEELTIDNEMNFIAKPGNPVKINIPLEIRLENDSMTVNIVTDKIEMYGDVYFTKIDVLPFFGAGGAQDEGYMVIPDGSGAIINFNNGKLQYQPIRIPVYGNDLAIEKKLQQLNQKQIHLPVFGIKNNNGGFISLIESSDGEAVINADIGGKTHSYNHIFSSFNLLSYASLSLPFGDFEPVNIFSEKYLSEDISIKYFFMEDNKSEYSDMAIYLKNYMMKRGLISSGIKKDIATLIEIIGAVDYKDTFLSIPYNSYKGLTKYNEIENIIRELHDYGVNDFVLKYSGWHSGGVNNFLSNKISLMSVLGSKSDFKKMIHQLESSGTKTYFETEILLLGKKRNFDGFNDKRDTARSLTNDLAFKYDYDLATRERISGSGKYILKPQNIGKIMEELISSYEINNIQNISLGSIGNDLYSDFKLGNNTNRNETSEILANVLEKVDDNGIDIITNGGNLYSLKHIDRLTESSFGSSRFYLTDYDVPFYQMVTGESINYHGYPINLSADYTTEFLKLLEYGGLPSFKGMFAPDYELKETDYNLYSLNYETWIEFAVETDRRLKDIFKNSQNHYLTKHIKLEEGVFISSYGETLDIITNYNNFTVTYMETSISPKSYHITKKKVNNE